MRKIERVMSVMTHVAIGAALGMVGWLAWAGVQVVSGEWKIPRAAPVVRQASAAAASLAPLRAPTTGATT